jgi:hypothetical protein
VQDLLCHYHFLAAVGEKLFDKPYSLLRARLRKLKVRLRLIELLKELYRYRASPDHEGDLGAGEVGEGMLALLVWVLQGNGKRYPAFPFGLPLLQLVKRCRQATDRAESWVPRPRSDPEREVLRRVTKLVREVDRDEDISTATRRLDQAWLAFIELREVLRLTTADLCRNDRSSSRQREIPSVEVSRLEQMKRDLDKHVSQLRASIPMVGKKVANPSPEVIILSYLDRYGDRLLGHPVLRDNDGRVIAVTERTNNLPEHLFGRTGQQLRRRVGRKNLGRDLKDQPAQAALVCNLLLPDYVRIVCGSLENLPEAFAGLTTAEIASCTLHRDTRDSEALRLVNKLLEDSQVPPGTEHGLHADDALSAETKKASHCCNDNQPELPAAPPRSWLAPPTAAPPEAT